MAQFLATFSTPLASIKHETRLPRNNILEKASNLCILFRVIHPIFITNEIFILWRKRIPEETNANQQPGQDLHLDWMKRIDSIKTPINAYLQSSFSNPRIMSLQYPESITPCFILSRLCCSQKEFQFRLTKE